MSRLINLIVVHCAATPNGKSLFVGEHGKPGFKTPIQVLDDMHRLRGFSRGIEFRKRQNSDLRSIGYHFVIYTNGVVATGRHLDEVGAHVQSHNAKSIGVCMIGTDGFSQAQWDSLAQLIDGLSRSYPGAKICGHRDLSPDLNKDGVIQRTEWLKICPGFDVAAWLKAGKKPDPKHVVEAAR